MSLATKYNQYGYIDWVNVASEFGHNMTNEQCRGRWYRLVDAGWVHNEAIPVDSGLVPDPSHDYGADVEKAFHGRVKKRY